MAQFNTRIGLKVDTLANWNNSNIQLLNGEIAIATIAATEGAGLAEPVAMIKIGDGTKTFSQLPWSFYAKAADVYGWAKAKDVVLENQVLKFKTDNTEFKTIDLSVFVTEDELATALTELPSQDTNTEYHIEYDSDAREIKLVLGADADKMTIDASEFIKDGMIKSVELVQADASGNEGQFLKITWNIDDASSIDEDSELDIVYVDVSTLVDVYTVAPNATEVQLSIDNNIISGTLVDNAITTSRIADKAVTAYKLTDALNTEIAKGVEAQGWGDHSQAGYATIEELAEVATTGKIEDLSQDTRVHLLCGGAFDE